MDKQRRFCFPVSPPISWRSSALRGPSLGPGPSSPGGRWVQLRHVPRLQAATSETTLLLSSQEHQATDTRGVAKQEEKGQGSVWPAWPRGLEEHVVLRLLPQGRGTTGWGHSIVSPDGRAGEPHVTEHVSEALESLTGLGANPTINPRGGSCFSQRTDTKAEPQETPRTRNHGSAKGSIDAPRTGNRLCPRQQRNCRKTGNL